MSLQRNVNIPQDIELLNHVWAIGNNFVNMIQLQNIKNTNIPRVAFALAYGLAFREECDSCWVPWEVRGNCVTSRPRKKRDTHIFFPAPCSFLKTPFPKGRVGLLISLHFYARLPHDGMQKERWVASSQTSDSTVWKSRALLPSLPSDGTGNSWPLVLLPSSTHPPPWHTSFPSTPLS